MTKKFPTTAAALLLAAGSTHTLAAGPLPAMIDVTGLDGDNGFTFNGVESGDRCGSSVSFAGDLNGDGFDDVIMGAYNATATGPLAEGQTYVVFGSSEIGASGSLSPASLNGSNGFIFDGVDQREMCGFSVTGIGDINNDGIDDALIGAPGFVAGVGEGRSYVVFGALNLGASGVFDLSSLDGLNGFTLDGVDQRDFSGGDVAAAGDLNADGLTDLVVGSPRANVDGATDAGKAYVIFGSSAIGASGSIELASLAYPTGFEINGVNSFDYVGGVLACAGDINGDGVDDIVIGSGNASPVGQNSAGSAYVVFGSSDIGDDGPLDLDSLNGSDGFVVNGVNPLDELGWSVNAAGDVNADGVEDLIVGALTASPGERERAGQTYVIFGAEDLGASGAFDLTTLNGGNGFVINGIDEFDRSGAEVAPAGDFNNDGVDDLIVGERTLYQVGFPVAPESHVIFGATNVGANGVLELANLNGANGVTIGDFGGIVRSNNAANGASPSDERGLTTLTRSMTYPSSAGDLNGDGIDDLIIGAIGDRPYGQNDAGEAFIVFGIQGNPADFNNDGAITAVDLATLLGLWGPCPPSPTPCIADLDADGQVGASDIAILISLWTN